jgi:methylenetetrahydrofolate dehydrogenase (NADP+)/methenyltetrahydrofolate cyclohydrolase
MSATIIDGKQQAILLNGKTKSEVEALSAGHHFAPSLAVVLVGHDPASEVYVRNKVRTAKELGINSLEYIFPADIHQSQLEAKISELSLNKEIDGILVQLPLPDGLNSDKVIELIDPQKDVDGLSEISIGKLALGKVGLRACTPLGVIILAKAALGENLAGKNVVIIGRSNLVGKPVAFLFLQENCTVTIAHSKTLDLPQICKNADILVAAVGRPKFVKGDWIKKGACVIDVGINRVAAAQSGKTKLVGDVDFDEAVELASYITPVPGGVGPMTIACLMANTVTAAKHRRNI